LAIRRTCGEGTRREGKEVLQQHRWSAYRDEPAADAFSDLTGRGLWQLGGVLAIAANPIPLSNRLTDQFDAMRWPTAFFQADADLSGKSEHFSDPPDVGSA
jgi:hypothetical protein